MKLDVQDGEKFYKRDYKLSFEAIVRCEAGASEPRRVRLKLSGEIDRITNQYHEPYTLFGDQDWDIDGRILNPGKYKLEALLPEFDSDSCDHAKTMEFEVLKPTKSCPCWSDEELALLPQPESSSDIDSYHLPKSCEEDVDSSNYSRWSMAFPDREGFVSLRTDYGYITDSSCSYEYIYCPDGDYSDGSLYHTSCEVTERESSFTTDVMFEACESTMQEAGTERGAVCFDVPEEHKLDTCADNGDRYTDC